MSKNFLKKEEDFIKKEKKLLIFSSSALVVAGILLLAYYYFVYIPYVAAYENSLLECKTLTAKDPSGLNIVFFASQEDTKKYSDYLFSVSPLNKLKGKFNIYYIDDYQPKCDIYRGVAILCYSRDLLRKASSCPNDFIIVLDKQTDEIRSSSYLNVMSLNTAHALPVVIHEFGHSFANLAEEYIPATIPRGSHNCQSSCTKFIVATDGCFQECSNGDYFRSIENGVMRTLSSTKFGIYNEKLIMDSFKDKYKPSSDSPASLTGRVTDTQDSLQNSKDPCRNQKYYLVETKRDENGKLVVGKRTLVQGCGPPESISTYNTGIVFTDAPGVQTPDMTQQEKESVPIIGNTFSAPEITFIQIPESQPEKSKNNKVNIIVTQHQVPEKPTQQPAPPTETTLTIDLDPSIVVVEKPAPSPIQVGADQIVQAVAAIKESVSESVSFNPSIEEIPQETNALESYLPTIGNGSNTTIIRVSNFTLANATLENETAQNETDNLTVQSVKNLITAEAIRELSDNNLYLVIPLFSLIFSIIVLIAFYKKKIH